VVDFCETDFRGVVDFAKRIRPVGEGMSPATAPPQLVEFGQSLNARRSLAA
jgi:hypothetical protein